MKHLRSVKSDMDGQRLINQKCDDDNYRDDSQSQVAAAAVLAGHGGRKAISLVQSER